VGGGDAAGGSRELAKLIDQYGEYLVADLKRFYNVDLADVIDGAGGLSPRRVLAYIQSLPMESATHAAVRGGDQFRGWDMHTYLLAQIIDSIRENTHTFVSANSKKKPKAPEPFPRPEKKRQKGNLFSTMARAAFLKNRNTDGGS
jgi:hypothetical protein